MDVEVGVGMVVAAMLGEKLSDCAPTIELEIPTRKRIVKELKKLHDASRANQTLSLAG